MNRYQPKNITPVFFAGLIFLCLAFLGHLSSRADAGSAYDQITAKSVPDSTEIISGRLNQPVLITAGIETCPPCRLIASSLLELQKDYAHIFQTHYYDLHRHAEATENFDIRMVPTLIFYDRSGQELFRYEGYLSKTHILKKWSDLGYEVGTGRSSLRPGEYFSLDYILSNLSLAVRGAPLSAMLAAFIWGILSVLLSPCHLAGIPLIIGYINRQKIESTSRATVLSLLFAAGILLSILMVGILSSAAGRIMGDLGALPYYLVSLVFVLFGLNLTGAVPMNWNLVDKLVPRDGRKRGAVFLGLVIGVGLGPCTFVFIAPILGLTLTLSAAEQAFGILLLGIFALAHCMLLVLAGISPRFINFFLRWNDLSLSSSVLRKICGILLISGGIYLFFYST